VTKNELHAPFAEGVVVRGAVSPPGLKGTGGNGRLPRGNGGERFGNDGKLMGFSRPDSHPEKDKSRNFLRLLDLLSEGDGTRTSNHRIVSPGLAAYGHSSTALRWRCKSLVFIDTTYFLPRIYLRGITSMLTNTVAKLLPNGPEVG